MPAFDLKAGPDALSESVIGAAIEVHRQLGPGLLESLYQGAMEQELLARGIAFSSEARLPVHCAQVLTYIRTDGFGRGLLINFNVSLLARGVRRFVC